MPNPFITTVRGGKTFGILPPVRGRRHPPRSHLARVGQPQTQALNEAISEELVVAADGAAAADVQSADDEAVGGPGDRIGRSNSRNRLYVPGPQNPRDPSPYDLHHMMEHYTLSKNDTHICTFGECGKARQQKVWKSKNNLRQHMLNFHLDSMSQCQVCAKWFKTPQSRSTHKTRIHPRD